jgi:hypothetical protein
VSTRNEAVALEKKLIHRFNPRFNANGRTPLNVRHVGGRYVSIDNQVEKLYKEERIYNKERRDVVPTAYAANLRLAHLPENFRFRDA